MSGVSNTEPVRRLLEDAVRVHALTTDKIAENARGLRGRSWLAARLTERQREHLLTDEELEALAAGYSVSRAELRRADLFGHGLAERQDDAVAWLTEQDVAGLTDLQRQAVRFVIEAMRDGAPVEEELGDADVLQLPHAARKRRPGSVGPST